MFDIVAILIYFIIRFRLRARWTRHYPHCVDYSWVTGKRFELASHSGLAPVRNCCKYSHRFHLLSFSDRIRTSVNVLGDGFGCGIIYHLTKERLIESDNDELVQQLKSDISKYLFTKGTRDLLKGKSENGSSCVHFQFSHFLPKISFL